MEHQLRNKFDHLTGSPGIPDPIYKELERREQEHERSLKRKVAMLEREKELMEQERWWYRQSRGMADGGAR